VRTVDIRESAIDLQVVHAAHRSRQVARRRNAGLARSPRRRLRTRIARFSDIRFADDQRVVAGSRPHRLRINLQHDRRRTGMFSMGRGAGGCDAAPDPSRDLAFRRLRKVLDDRFGLLFQQRASPRSTTSQNFPLIPQSRLTRRCHPRYLLFSNAKPRRERTDSQNIRRRRSNRPRNLSGKRTAGCEPRWYLERSCGQPQLADGITLSGKQDRWGRSQCRPREDSA